MHELVEFTKIPTGEIHNLKVFHVEELPEFLENIVKEWNG